MLRVTRYAMLFAASGGIWLLGCGKEPTSADGKGRIVVEILWGEESQGRSGPPPEVLKLRLTVQPGGIVRTFDPNLLRLEVSGISPGTYSAMVEGLNDQDMAIYGGSADEIQVTAGKRRLVLVTMTPDLPSVPMLQVSGPDAEGTYTLQWTAEPKARSYVLQEASHPAFEHPVTVYAGSETRKEIRGRHEGTYYYRVKAVNEAGKSGWSAVVVVQISPPETQGLVVTITSPSDGAKVSGKVDIVVTVSHGVDAVWAHFYVDGVQKESILRPPYVYSWDTSWEAIGPHTLSVTANDAAGHIGTSPVLTVTVVPVSQPVEIVLIPAGMFWMGSLEDQGSADEHPRHEVYVDAFYMDKYEVSYAQYRLFDPDHPVEEGEEHPVADVSWYEAARYCNWRSRQEGLESCYDWKMWTCDFTKQGYRLPTEAEWEKAARGGQIGTSYPWGDEDPSGKANYRSDGTSPTGSYAPNAYGLHDMAGNVWEWCHDWYDPEYYRSGPASNPTGPGTGDARVLRGGSWAEISGYLRCAARSFSDPGYGHSSIGFRCVRRAP